MNIIPPIQKKKKKKIKSETAQGIPVVVKLNSYDDKEVLQVFSIGLHA